MSNNSRAVRRGQPLVLLLTTILTLLVASSPVSVPALAVQFHSQQINSPSYKNTHGLWDVVDLPPEFRLNTVHAALLPTGKVLLVAGTGNNQADFNSYHDQGTIAVLKTVLFDPSDNSVEAVSTPKDFFCGGHTLLHSGNLLVAGGTSGYEVLDGHVKKPGGSMIIHDEDPNGAVKVLKKGTKFVSPLKKVYLSTQDVTVYPATKMDSGNGNVMIMHSSATVFVEAIAEDASYTTSTNDHFSIAGLQGTDTHNIYGQGGPITLTKQDFRGDNGSYEFDPIKKAYIRTGSLNVSRWYPTLSVLTDGSVIATSGLDNTGVITSTTEQYDPILKKWSLGPNQAFATYPALFRTKDPDSLFYSGSNAGYGPADKGRQPGFWNIKTNVFQAVSGLRQSDIVENSGSVALPPRKGSNDGVQDNRILLAGGGGVGESPLVSSRTDIVDLAEAQPRYIPGPDLPAALRYLNLTVTPWDDVIANGGSSDYRAKGNSYSHATFSIDPTTNTLTSLADEIVGRSYHSGSLLLPDGRILVFGNDPLYSDKDNTARGAFDQRLEIYTAPQLFQGPRPMLTDEPQDTQQVHRGQQLSYLSKNSGIIRTARMIPPSTATHVTNIEQRSIAAIVKTTTDGRVTVDLPSDENLVPNGWYMLFVNSDKGTPSYAKMIQVVD